MPPEIALEHLRKPSIKPSPESDSIYVPAEPKPDVVPMEIDTGKGKAIMIDPGTAQLDPGISRPKSAEGMPVNSGTALSQETVSVDVLVAISNWVDSINRDCFL